jgi:hypothetical protein
VSDGIVEEWNDGRMKRRKNNRRDRKEGAKFA